MSEEELRRRAAQLVAREKSKLLPIHVRNFLIGVAVGLALAVALIWANG